jgi:small subunit ribosomal protein S20e
VTNRLVTSAKNEKLKTYGPVRHPTKTLRLTVRKSPCGNGTDTFDRFEMRIHKRVVTLISPPEFIKKVTDFSIDPGVEVELHLTDV